MYVHKCGEIYVINSKLLNDVIKRNLYIDSYKLENIKASVPLNRVMHVYPKNETLYRSVLMILFWTVKVALRAS